MWRALAALIAGVIYICDSQFGRPSGDCRMSTGIRWGVAGLWALSAGLDLLPAYVAGMGQLQAFEQTSELPTGGGSSGGGTASGNGMLYIAQDGVVYVYDENTWNLVQTINLSQIHGVRGIDIGRGGDSMMYISYEN